MKLLAVRLARSIWLLPPYFLNPKGIFLRPAVEVMKARYKFLRTTLDNPAAPPSTEFKYENGAFDRKNGPVSIVSMTLHNDGIVVDTRSSTDDADSFLEDVIDWMSKEYGLPPHTEMPVKRIYVSELNVSFPRAPVFLNQKFAPLVDEISSTISDDIAGKVDFLGFQLATDRNRGNRQATFRIEREINTEIGENRYYAFATAKTDTHIKLLKMLEKLAV